MIVHAWTNHYFRWVILGGVVLVFYVVVEIVDRATESPGMRANVNAASAKYLAERGSVWRAAGRATIQWLSDMRNNPFG